MSEDKPTGTLVPIVRHYSHSIGTESAGGFFPSAIPLSEEGDPYPQHPGFESFEDMAWRMDELDRIERGDPPTTVELVTLEEQQREQAAHRNRVPIPQVILDRPPLTQFSMVGAIEVSSELLMGFLSALSVVAPKYSSNDVLLSTLATYQSDPNQMTGAGELTLEATDGSTWAQVTMKARAQRQDDFLFSMPIERSLAIINLLRTQYTNVAIGMDRGRIFIGPYSMPFSFLLDQFPPRTPILMGEARVALPAAYVRRIIDCLAPVQAANPTGFLGIHLNLLERVALATDGRRIHVLALPDLAFDLRNPSIAPPRITIPTTFFHFLAAVVDQKWAALEMNEEQVTALGEDFAISSHVTTERFVDWKVPLSGIHGHWLVDRHEMVASLHRALISSPTVRLTAMGDGLSLESSGTSRLRQSIRAQRSEHAPPESTAVLEIQDLMAAVLACQGGLVRLGFSSNSHHEPIMVRGEGIDFTAILMTKE